MKKFVYSLALACLLLPACDIEPLYIESDLNWKKTEPQTLQPTHTIRELAAMYQTGKPFVVNTDLIIGGQVISTDQPGNFYKSLYLQDATAGIELKIGRNGLYNDYKQGQWVYVNCRDLSIGMYGFKTGNYGGSGMVQIGFSDPTGEYETSYIESPLLVNTRIIRGEQGIMPDPIVVASSSDLPSSSDSQVGNSLLGKLVTLKNMYYRRETFALLYLDSTKDKTLYTNRVFLSDTNGKDPTHGITTWAMSKMKMTEYLEAGLWDDCKIGSGSTFTGQTLADFKGDGTYPEVEKAAYSVSQYFTFQQAEIQVRTSGFCKFADLEIPEDVLSGRRALDMTGILTIYQGSLQLIVNSQDDWRYADTGEKVYP